MKYLFYITLLMLSTTSAAHAQNIHYKTIPVGEQTYDSLSLKNNYKLVYTTDSSDNDLWLTGTTGAIMVGGSSKDIPESNETYFSNDFDGYFTLATGAGSGMFYMDLYRKRDGKQLFRAIGISCDTVNSMVYFSKNESLVAINLENHTINYLIPPGDISRAQWWNCIEQITKERNTLIIKYDAADTVKMKKYRLSNKHHFKN